MNEKLSRTQFKQIETTEKQVLMEPWLLDMR